jgi:FOG: Glucan-binding domain (YG repeat)
MRRVLKVCTVFLLVAILTLTTTQVAKAGTWKQDARGWWYANTDNTYPTNTWQMIGNTWYHFNASGYMSTGWLGDGNDWYHLKGSGAMSTGWLRDSNDWYHLKGSGAMSTGWLRDGNDWYHLKGSGAMNTGWLRDGNDWYHLKDSGAMTVNQWVGDYYLEASGAMAISKWIGQYWVGADGKWIPNYQEPVATKPPVVTQPPVATTPPVTPQPSQLVNVWKEVEIKDATCSQAGYVIEKCEVSGEVRRIDLPALGHDIGNWEVMSAPTCNGQGYRVRRCKRGGEILESGLIPATGHKVGNWTASINLTCETDGEYVKKCISCNEILEREERASSGHSYRWDIAKHPTVGVAGERTRSCYFCEDIAEREVIPRLETVNIDRGNGQIETVTGYFDIKGTERIINLVNEERGKIGVAPLVVSENLMRMAKIRVAETAVHYSHTRPNGTQWNTIFPQGAHGENIAHTPSGADRVMEMWMNSSGHRANLLNDEFVTIGVGAFVAQTKREGDYYYQGYYVQVFGLNNI